MQLVTWQVLTTGVWLLLILDCLWGILFRLETVGPHRQGNLRRSRVFPKIQQFHSVHSFAAFPLVSRSKLSPQIFFHLIELSTNVDFTHYILLPSYIGLNTLVSVKRLVSDLVRIPRSVRLIALRPRATLRSRPVARSWGRLTLARVLMIAWSGLGIIPLWGLFRGCTIALRCLSGRCAVTLGLMSRGCNILLGCRMLLGCRLVSLLWRCIIAIGRLLVTLVRRCIVPLWSLARGLIALVRRGALPFRDLC